MSTMTENKVDRTKTKVLQKTTYLPSDTELESSSSHIYNGPESLLPPSPQTAKYNIIVGVSTEDREVKEKLRPGEDYLFSKNFILSSLKKYDAKQDNHQKEEDVRFESGIRKDYYGISNADRICSKMYLLSQRRLLSRSVAKVVMSQVKCYPMLNTVPTLTVEDFPSPEGVSPGTVATGVVTHVKDPSDFFVVFESRIYYALDHPGWTEHFTAFRSGPEAHFGIHALLNVTYVLGDKHISKRKRFANGDLVAVQVLRSSRITPPLNKTDIVKTDTKELQTRRGVIMEVLTNEGEELQYLVYLMDFGYTVIVSESFTYPLLKPFNFILPLAVRCGLHGISPIGESWSHVATAYFSQQLELRRDHIFSFQILSRGAANKTRIVPDFTTTLLLSVNVALHKVNSETGRLGIGVNLTELLTQQVFGIPWNHFPARPKLMEGMTISQTDAPSSSASCQRFAIPYREAILLTPEHPRIYDLLPLAVLEREVKKLFLARGKYMIDIRGMHNKLMVALDDPNKIFCKPSNILMNLNAKEIVSFLPKDSPPN